MSVTIHHGNCLDVLDELPENSVDAVVCDPPYGLGFMGKHWDHADNVAFRADTWARVLRVLKPGGHLVAFSGTRTYHRMAVAIEDAGFELRDMVSWVYGSGFPKSHDVSKGIDKAAGAERTECLGPKPGHEDFASRETTGHLQTENHNDGWKRPWKEREDANKYHFQYAPATDAAKQWMGWGTALKPSLEPIALARKPLSEGTVAANVLRWRTGALNIDATRIAAGDDHKANCARNNVSGIWREHGYVEGVRTEASPLGRWPANFCHDGSEEVLAGFPQSKDGVAVNRNRNAEIPNEIYGKGWKHSGKDEGYGSSGSAARFFYCAKANKTDRANSKHPTVKPVSLMRWLVRMVTPPGGVVLDPFAGSGTTGQAALEEGFRAILIEREEEYIADIRRRIELASDDAPLFSYAAE